jgi:periplasmic divalent cation tolerance protein
MTDKILVFTTCSSPEEAERITRKLVEARLAACVSASAPVRSIYRWQGAIEEAQEVALTIKTRRSLFAQVQAAIKSVHSYTTAEIIAVGVVEGSADYMDWMDRELKAEE